MTYWQTFEGEEMTEREMIEQDNLTITLHARSIGRCAFDKLKRTRWSTHKDVFNEVELPWSLKFRDDMYEYEWDQLDNHVSVWFKEHKGKLYIRLESTECVGNHDEVKTDWFPIGWVDAYNLMSSADSYSLHVSLDQFNLKLMEAYLQDMPKLREESRVVLHPVEDISNEDVEF